MRRVTSPFRLRNIVIGMALVTGLATGACSQPRSETTPKLPTTQLVDSSRAWDSVAWTSEGLFVLEKDLRARARSALLRFDPESGMAEPVELLPPSSCPKIFIRSLGVSSAGRLLGAFDCLPILNLGIAEIDPSSGRVRVLIEHLPGVGPPAWDEASRSGVTAIDSAICSTLLFYAADRGQVHSDGVIGNPPNAWDVDAYWKNNTEHPQASGIGDCEDPAAGGLLRKPALSQDGVTLAFFASTEAIGRHGRGRTDSNYELWTSTANGSDAQKRVDDVQHPRFTTWSPSGQCLLFEAELRGDYGLWVWGPTLEATPILDGEFLNAAWSPDGARILALQQDPNDDTRSYAELVDVARSPALSQCASRSSAESHRG